MPVLSKAADYYLTYRFIKTLTTPFVDTEAYKLGIIDDEGNILKQMKELKSKEEKKAYGYFERMVWNLKKLIDKIPTKIFSYSVYIYKNNKTWACRVAGTGAEGVAACHITAIGVLG